VNRESDIDCQGKIYKLLATVWAWSILKCKKNMILKESFPRNGVLMPRVTEILPFLTASIYSVGPALAVC